MGAHACIGKSYDACQRLNGHPLYRQSKTKTKNGIVRSRNECQAEKTNIDTYISLYTLERIKASQEQESMVFVGSSLFIMNVMMMIEALYLARGLLSLVDVCMWLLLLLLDLVSTQHFVVRSRRRSLCLCVCVLRKLTAMESRI